MRTHPPARPCWVAVKRQRTPARGGFPRGWSVRLRPPRGPLPARDHAGLDGQLLELGRSRCATGWPGPTRCASRGQQFGQHQPSAVARAQAAGRSPAATSARCDRQAERLGWHPRASTAQAHSRRTSRWFRIARMPLRSRYGSIPMSDKPADRPGRAAGVEGGQHQVSGQRGLERGLGRDAVADLAHQDHFGILPHQGPQTGGQVEAGRSG